MGNQDGNVGNQGGNAGNWVEMLGMWLMRGIGVGIFLFISLTKIPERKGSISPSSFYGQLPYYQSHVFCLVYQMDELSFKEMRTFLCFFGSNVGILNIIMLIQILFYQNCKQHVHSRLVIHSMICFSANLLVREIH